MFYDFNRILVTNNIKTSYNDDLFNLAPSMNFVNTILDSSLNQFNKPSYKTWHDSFRGIKDKPGN